jgi:hypothetical protein
VQLFYFVLKAGRQTIPDLEGQELADRTEARQHAIAVARQLMRHREGDTRSWRLQVCDDYLRPLFSVYFVEVDEDLNQFSPTVQASIEDVARTTGAFNDALDKIQVTLTDVRATLERASRVLGSIPGTYIRL